MENIDQEDLLFLLAHYAALTRKEKWTVIEEMRLNLAKGLPKRPEKVVLSFKKRAALKNYLKEAPLQKLKDRYKKEGIHYVTLASQEYPYLLRHIYDPPMVLFYKGDYSLLNGPALGIVGARECTQYGTKVLDMLLPPLIKEGIASVSGLARGIDGHVHQDALKYGGKTLGIIGTGINVFYPKENEPLQMKMYEEGLVISEYPLDTVPRKHHFPMRNRIISGISDGVLVVEARKRSGSLITARMALEEGRDVFAVPGSILSELSKGCNALIKQGAIPVTHPLDILNEWNGS